MQKLNAMVIFGGPSGERGISMNSARSVVDQLRDGWIHVASIIYVDKELSRFELSPGQLYSNTPLDFDFKKREMLEEISENAFKTRCAECDLVIPLIHGAYGEDGSLQRQLESLGVAFVGSGSEAAEQAYDKGMCYEALIACGIDATPSLLCKPGAIDHATEKQLDPFLNADSFVLKPTRGGSSLGIKIIRREPGRSPVKQLKQLCERGPDEPEILAQPMLRGREFSVVVIEGPGGPVALPPIEIERDSAELDSEIFSYHEKYLPSEHVRFNCPPTRDEGEIDRLRDTCELVFKRLEMRDWARVDCWILDDGRLLVSDVNPVSGTEQNSIMFICAAECGISHQTLLELVCENALRRHRIWHDQKTVVQDIQSNNNSLRVIFGGNSSERQVSVLSGVNTWLKLRNVPNIDPVPYFLNQSGRIARLGYSAALRHSVEEIEAYLLRPSSINNLAQQLGDEVRTRLGIQQAAESTRCGPWESIEAFLEDRTPVFLGLHGGIGEDGTMQRILHHHGVPYNGSPEDVCQLCMSKIDTAKRIKDAQLLGVRDQRSIEVDHEHLCSTAANKLWSELTAAIDSNKIVIKPAADGCSTGVVVLMNSKELGHYTQAIREGATEISGAYFSQHISTQRIGMPMNAGDFMAEPFIETDSLGISEQMNGAIDWGRTSDTGWIEITAGVIEIDGELECLPPSLSVAEQGVLSKEEKFMGGTGINYTPPPPPPYGRVEPKAVERAEGTILSVAKLLGIRGYARIDAFMHCETGEIIVIECNALPALTPSTVLFQQGVARSPSLLPHELLAQISPIAHYSIRTLR